MRKLYGRSGVDFLTVRTKQLAVAALEAAKEVTEIEIGRSVTMEGGYLRVMTRQRFLQTKGMVTIRRRPLRIVDAVGFGNTDPLDRPQ